GHAEADDRRMLVPGGVVCRDANRVVAVRPATTKVVVMPTDCVGPPSMLISYRAMPDARSEPVHEMVTSGVVWTPLGEPPSVGGVRSTSTEVDDFGSTKPAVSQDW